MTMLRVDPGRLGQEAETLGNQVSAINQASDDLTRGSATAKGNCGSVSDDGLHGALQHLSDAWGYEIAAIGSDLGPLAALMKGLAQAYAQQDSQGITQINGG